MSYNFKAAQFKQKLLQLPKLLWLPIGYLLLAALHSLILQRLPVPVAMPPALTTSLQQHPVTLTELEQSVERLAKLKKLAEL